MEVDCTRCRKGVMLPRINRSNNNKFYGCSNFPDCRKTMTQREYDLAGTYQVGEEPDDGIFTPDDYDIFHDY